MLGKGKICDRKMASVVFEIGCEAALQCSCQLGLIERRQLRLVRRIDYDIVPSIGLVIAIPEAPVVQPFRADDARVRQRSRRCTP